MQRALRDQLRGAANAQVTGKLAMLRIGHERERTHLAAAAHAHTHEARLVHVIAHLAVPQVGKHARRLVRGDAKRHAPA